MNEKTETLQIEGMNCGHCVHAVRQALQGVQGVQVEQVEIGSARVRYDADRVNREALVAAVEEAGYPVKG